MVKGQGVQRELLPNQSLALLKALHLLTREGNLNADALRKLKQVNHLVRLLTPGLEDIFSRFPNPCVVDVGSGNAYLGFILYELFFKGESHGEVLSIENREDLTQRARERAHTLGFSRMKFETASVENASYPERIHLVTALHACDTATDDALAVAILKKADYVAVVPCCQAEVAQQLKEHPEKASGAIRTLTQHAWHRREFASHLTNVIRAQVLESHGYQVTVTELTGWEHSLKNELILGRKVHRESRPAQQRLSQLLTETGVTPKIVQLLSKLGTMTP